MKLLEFWQAMSGARKAGLVVSVVLVLALLAGFVFWMERSDYEVIARSSSSEKIAVAVREIERLKIPYKVTDDGNSIAVPRSEMGRVRVSLAGASGASSPAVGFELFNNSDFSTTEFTQKINYQRALQGELARTIDAISGVASARVHIVLPESSLLRRKTVPATAAVDIVMEPGAQLGAAQVYGIQKLVAAAVPELHIDDITVIDQDGIALTKSKVDADDASVRTQLELKREVDAYLESKIRRLLSNFDPHGEFSISVDASLTPSDVKVTTDDLIPADNGSGKSVGLVSREKVSQHRDLPVTAADAASAPGSSSGALVRDVEYKFGRRIEQIATAPGDIERISVAVLARSSADAQIEQATLKDLISNAIGAQQDRGDSVAIVILPAHAAQGSEPVPTQHMEVPLPGGRQQVNEPTNRFPRQFVGAMAWMLGVAICLFLAWLSLRPRDRTDNKNPMSDADIQQMAERVERWLQHDNAPAKT